MEIELGADFIQGFGGLITSYVVGGSGDLVSELMMGATAVFTCFDIVYMVDKYSSACFSRAAAKSSCFVCCNVSTCTVCCSSIFF